MQKMNGDGTFNALILLDKLAKLNSSQQSIETLSHWCIFHRKNAKQVVETWERQFHLSPRDQRVSFLYLANDILQNSRRKGMEFVGEFWKVLPSALNDVIENGDELGRKEALRLVDIWEERKVFIPRGQTLKEELLGRNRNERNISYKLKQPNRDMLEKLIASYQHASNSYDEDTLFGKCRAVISSVIKVQSEIGSDFNLGNITGTGVADKLQVQCGLLRECIEQLKVAESSRLVLASHLREALNEQECKIEQLRNQLQVARVRYEQVEGVLIGQAPLPPLPEQNLDEVPPTPPPPPPPPSAYTKAPPPPDFPPESPATTIGDRVQATSVHCTPQQSQGPLSDITLHRQITSASDVGAKHISSTSSGHMFSYVLSSLPSEGVIGQSGSEVYLSDANKRPRLNNGSLGSIPCYLPQPQQQQPPPFPHPDAVHQPPPPPLPLILPPVPSPLPPTGSMSVASFSYGTPPVQPLPPAYPMVGVSPFPGPPNPYQFQGSDGFFGQPPYPAGPPPFSRQ